MGQFGHWSGEVNRTITDLQNSVLQLQKQPLATSGGKIRARLLPVGHTTDPIQLDDPESGYNWAVESLDETKATVVYDSTAHTITVTGVAEADTLVPVVCVPGGDPLEAIVYVFAVYDTDNTPLPRTVSLDALPSGREHRSIFTSFTTQGNYMWSFDGKHSTGNVGYCYNLDTGDREAFYDFEAPTGHKVVHARILFTEPGDASITGNHLWGYAAQTGFLSGNFGTQSGFYTKKAEDTTATFQGGVSGRSRMDAGLVGTTSFGAMIVGQGGPHYSGTIGGSYASPSYTPNAVSNATEMMGRVSRGAFNILSGPFLYVTTSSATLAGTYNMGFGTLASGTFLQFSDGLTLTMPGTMPRCGMWENNKRVIVRVPRVGGGFEAVIEDTSS